MPILALASTSSALEQSLQFLATALRANASGLALAALAIGVCFQVLKRLKAAWWRKLSQRVRITVVILAGGVVSMSASLATGSALRDAATMALAGVLSTSGYKLLKLWNLIDGFDASPPKGGASASG